MFTDPYIASQLARERQHDMLAQAEQRRLRRQFRDPAITPRNAEGTSPRRRRARAWRRALRLGTPARA
jgi:hypothetical protein